MRTDTVSSLRQRMIEDMNARKLGSHTQRSHISSCKRFAAFLTRSPDTATAEDIRRFQLHLSETGVSICSRNRTMTGLRFLFRVTLRRLDLAAEIYHIREPQKIPLVMSPDETRRLLAVADNLKVRTLLGLGYGCGLRAGEVVRLKVKHIDKAQKIIRVEPHCFLTGFFTFRKIPKLVVRGANIDIGFRIGRPKSKCLARSLACTSRLRRRSRR